MSAFFKLIRLPNLLIIAVTQILMRYLIVIPLLKINGLAPLFTLFDFIILVLATTFISAAGYVINDYFDMKTDLVNRPETVIVGNKIKRRYVMFIHIIINVLGIFFGFYVSMQIQLPQLGFIYILIAGVLWYYSTTYKRQFLIGNIIVSLLVGMVPIMVALYEIPPQIAQNKQIIITSNFDIYEILFWVLAFGFFGFISTLIREIIKDLEDFEGDNIYGRNTVPIILGKKNAKIIIIALIFFTIISLIFISLKFLNDLISAIYISLTILIPYVILANNIIKAKNKKDYSKANQLSKLTMLTGIMYSFIAYYNFTL